MADLGLFYTIGGITLLISLWHSAYKLWKKSDLPVVKERNRQAMREFAKKIKRAKEEDE